MTAKIDPRQFRINLGCAILLLALTWIDYATGYEFGFFIFYFIPVSIAAWYVGRKSGLTFAVASAVAWFLSDRLTHHPYSRSFFIYWETFMRLVSFVTTALTLFKIRELASAQRQLQDSLHEAHEENRKLKLRLEQGEPGRQNAGDHDSDS